MSAPQPEVALWSVGQMSKDLGVQPVLRRIQNWPGLSLTQLVALTQADGLTLA